MPANTVTMTVERKPATRLGDQVTSHDQVTTSVDVGSGEDARTSGRSCRRRLRELGQTDAFYGNEPERDAGLPVHAHERAPTTTRANNTYTKEVRFYVQRSDREAMVAVENFNGYAGDVRWRCRTG